MSQTLKFNVFGKIMSVERKNHEWVLFVDSSTGFKNQINDVVIPNDLKEDNLESFLDDMYHEWATVENPKVERIL